MDIFPTLAAAVGAPEMVPTDRPIDGVNQLPFLEGKHSHSNRDSVIYMGQGGRLMAVKWHDWKLWYDFRVEPGDPNPDSKVRLFNLRTDPKEETDIKDFNPGILTVMDRIVADYRASVEQFPNVPVDADDPYTPSYDERKTGHESRQEKEVPAPLATSPSGEAFGERPDFTGKWTRTATRDEPNSAESGWGSEFFIVQHSDRIVVERAFFSRPDLQPPLTFTYFLDGSESRNSILIGRGMQEQVSKVIWEEDKLVITTTHTNPGEEKDQRVTSEVRHTLSFERPSRQAHPPLLVIETIRSAIESGLASTTRTIYTKI
jgi:hypothetical protein